jgi:hemolysin activation/secretion protein
LVIALAAVAALTLPARAQPAAMTGPASSPGTPAAPAAPNPLAGGAPFVVARFAFDGHTVFTTAELEAIAAPFVHRPLRFVDLEELRQRLSRAYVERGYVSSGALIGPDALRDGTLTVRIVEGVVGEVRTRGLERLHGEYVAARLTRRGEPLNVQVLQERFRLLLADPLFARVNVRLVPGEALGRAILDVDAERATPYRLAIFANNHQAPAVGSAQAGLEGSVANLTGWGDLLAATLSTSRGADHADASWTMPLAAQRTFAVLHLASGDASVIEEPVSELDIGSRTRTRELTIGHPVLESARRKLVLGLTYGERRNRTTLDGVPFSFVAGESTGSTEVKAWRFFQDLVVRFERRVLALRSTFVAGRNNLVADDLVPDQASTRYRFWLGQAQAAFDVGEAGRQVLVRAQLQASEDRLVPLEQMSLGGRHTVRGYRENTLVRDNGAYVGVEWREPLAPLLGGDATWGAPALIPFIDLGSAHNRGGERKRLASAGLGLKWTWRELDAELFWAGRLERRPVDTQGDLQDHGIHVSLRWRVF